MIDYPRILINRRAALGDVLMTTPILRKLYNEHNQKCFIDFSINEEYKSLIEDNPYIRTVITLPYKDIDLHDYDLIINLDLVYEKQPLLHPVNAYSNYVFGQELFSKEIDFFTKDAAKVCAQNFKNTINNDYIVFHLRNAYGTSRNLPMQFWHDLLNELVGRINQSIIFVGSFQDNFFQGHPQLIDARGQFDLPALKEVIANSKLFVGTDSGPMHIATTTTTNIVAMFTSVKYEYRQPQRNIGNFYPFVAKIDCYGCQANFLPPVTAIHCMRNDYECVKRFSPREVGNCITKILTQ